MPKWIDDLNAQVIERDESLCLICGRIAADVHHIVPKGRAKKHSKTAVSYTHLTLPTILLV